MRKLRYSTLLLLLAFYLVPWTMFGESIGQHFGKFVGANSLKKASLRSTNAAFAQAGGFGNDNQGCAFDQPCFNGYRQIGNTIVFHFTGVCCWDFFNVRYAVVGGEKQVENRSGSFTFTNVKPRHIYTLKVQGCKSHTFARSTCSQWVAQSVTSH